MTEALETKEKSSDHRRDFRNRSIPDVGKGRYQKDTARGLEGNKMKPTAKKIEIKIINKPEHENKDRRGAGIEENDPPMCPPLRDL